MFGVSVRKRIEKGPVRSLVKTIVTSSPDFGVRASLSLLGSSALSLSASAYSPPSVLEHHTYSSNLLVMTLLFCSVFTCIFVLIILYHIMPNRQECS